LDGDVSHFKNRAAVRISAASLTLSAVGAGQLEIQLRASPNTIWRLEMSGDLKNWSDYPAPNAETQAGMDGVYRARVSLSGANQFFRARRGDH